MVKQHAECHHSQYNIVDKHLTTDVDVVEATATQLHSEHLNVIENRQNLRSEIETFQEVNEPEACY